MSKPYFTQTIHKFPDRLVGGSDFAFVSSSTAAETKFNRNPAIDVAADSLAAPRRNFEADSAAPVRKPREQATYNVQRPFQIVLVDTPDLELIGALASIVT